MLVEIAAANLIFKTLSTALGNGKSIFDMGVKLGEYFELTHKINTKAEDKSSGGSALEAFQYQEKLKSDRETLRYHLNKSRLCAWSDFINFEAEWHRERKEKELELKRKKYQRQKSIHENIAAATKAAVILLIIIAALFGVALYLRY